MIGGMDGIGAIAKMMELAQGAEKLGQGGAQGSQAKQDPMKMLMEILSKAMGGAQGGGSGGAEGGQMDQEMLDKVMAGRQGMEAMMPESDNGRKIEV